MPKQTAVDFAEETKALVYKHLDVPGLFQGFLQGPVERALQELVESTSTPFDDVLKAAVYQKLVDEVAKLGQQCWDALLAPSVKTLPA